MVKKLFKHVLQLTVHLSQTQSLHFCITHCPQYSRTANTNPLLQR